MQRPNRFYVTFSLSLSLLLLGLVAYAGWRAGDLAKQMSGGFALIVELEADHTTEQQKELLNYLRAATFADTLRPPSFESKETALNQMDRELEEDLSALGINNPLLDVVSFHVRPQYLSAEGLQFVQRDVQLRPGVRAVYYQDVDNGGLLESARRAAWVAGAVALLFLFISVLLMHNTVRLSLSANRMLIKTQELVGAKWSFIRRPYLWRGVWQGFVAGTLAALALAGLLYGLHRYLPDLRIYDTWPAVAIIGGSLIGLGVVVSYASYYVGVRRYLRLPMDALY